ncbi:hypothetical protein HK096_008983, partial [Nowakowskiella sp. JEL0078]
QSVTNMGNGASRQSEAPPASQQTHSEHLNVLEANASSVSRTRAEIEPPQERFLALSTPEQSFARTTPEQSLALATQEQAQELSTQEQAQELATQDKPPELSRELSTQEQPQEVVKTSFRVEASSPELALLPIPNAPSASRHDIGDILAISSNAMNVVRLDLLSNFQTVGLCSQNLIEVLPSIALLKNKSETLELK